MPLNDDTMISGYKRIAIFYPWGNLGAFSNLKDALTLLSENGYEVDFFTIYNPSYPQPETNVKGLSIYFYPEAFSFFTESYPQLILRIKKGGRPYRWLMTKIFYPVLRVISYNNFLHRRCASQPYSFVIGIDPEGLASAATLAKRINKPLIYWSLELLFTSETTNQEQKRLKRLEIKDCKEAIFTIIQDHWRGQALIDENGIEPSKIFFVPNAPRGKARREKNDYLQQRLNISAKRKVVLCAGSITNWTMSQEIIRSANLWPDDYLLVMQSRKRKNGQLDEYWNDIIKLIDPTKVIISFDPIPQSEFRYFVDSADVGIAFYTPAPLEGTTAYGKNITLIGLSSGKIASYLYSGLPVIVNDTVIGPSDLVNTSQCGISIGKTEEIKDALKSIFEEYNEYSANACMCFDQELELEKHFASVIEQMELDNGRRYTTADNKTL